VRPLTVHTRHAAREGRKRWPADGDVKFQLSVMAGRRAFVPGRKIRQAEPRVWYTPETEVRS